MYKCECGREFESKVSRAGHYGHCKIHLGEEKYNSNLEIQRNNQMKAARASADVRIVKSEAKNKEWEEHLKIWITEGHTCENCGRVMTEYYGSGKFCCESCSRSYSSNCRSDELKEYHASFLNHEGNLGYCSLSHEQRSAIMKEVASRPEHKERFINNVIPAAHTPEAMAKQAESLRIAYKEGRNKGWTTRSNIRTNTEIFWDKVLYDNNIEHIQEYSINKKDLGIIDSPGYYRLDFLIIKGNIDLEIDGRVHRGSRLEHDNVRDSALERNGYIVHRIQAIDPNENPDEVNKQIENFLEWYRNILDVSTAIKRYNLCKL